MYCKQLDSFKERVEDSVTYREDCDYYQSTVKSLLENDETAFSLLLMETMYRFCMLPPYSDNYYCS